MHPILKFSELAYLETQHLVPLLKDYKNPQDLIFRLVKKKELIRLKKGFFVIADKIKEMPPPYEQIANLLYGPSYVSFEWALSFYGMIPEGVYVITSVSVNRSKTFKTPLATFDYTYLSPSRYAVGIEQGKNSAGNFLIATPEKALADLVHFKSAKLDKKDLLKDLIEGRRIDAKELSKLNKKHLMDIADRYRSQAVTTLTSTLGLI